MTTRQVEIQVVLDTDDAEDKADRLKESLDDLGGQSGDFAQGIERAETSTSSFGSSLSGVASNARRGATIAAVVIAALAGVVFGLGRIASAAASMGVATRESVRFEDALYLAGRAFLDFTVTLLSALGVFDFLSDYLERITGRFTLAAQQAEEGDTVGALLTAGAGTNPLSGFLNQLPGPLQALGPGVPSVGGRTVTQNFYGLTDPELRQRVLDWIRTSPNASASAFSLVN